ncbi:MAG: hypothetical protein JW934_11500 [Anaerolineae bacterium]|nr:hypothetical protein [Anaerolineae bacterium]
MAKSASGKDLLDTISHFLAHNKGLPVFLGVGLALLGLILNCIPNLYGEPGFWGWMARSDVLLHLGVIIGLLGILLGDAL